MFCKDIVRQTHRILFLVLAAFVLIVLRVWYFTTIDRQAQLKTSEKSMQRVENIPASRGVIQDRFGIPLAVNQLEYRVCLLYQKIREAFPQRKKRLTYLKELTRFLSDQLNIDPTVIQDKIHGEAAIFPTTSCVLKRAISEPLYYQLRNREKDWVGLHVELFTKRWYPKGKTASHIVGYLGAIDSNEHRAIVEELASLRSYLSDLREGLPVPLPRGFTTVAEVQKRYEQLRDKAYTAQALVGKLGIEKSCEERLRGKYGKRFLEIGGQGQTLSRSSSEWTPIPGESLTLTLSVELQQFAEELLIRDEKERRKNFSFAGKNHSLVAPPWVLGGAIVAMLPSTGEVVALASYPRFDPNDFLADRPMSQEAKKKIYRWLESIEHRSALWDGKALLIREEYESQREEVVEEKKGLSWDFYLDCILTKNSSVRSAISLVNSVGEAARLIAEWKRRMGKTSSIPVDKEGLLDPFFRLMTHQEDELLFLDLLRLVIDEKKIPPSFVRCFDQISLSEYRLLTQHFFSVEEKIKSAARDLYLRYIFPKWRANHFSSYLKRARDREEALGTYARSYVHYLVQAQRTLFAHFWETHRWELCEATLFSSTPRNTPLHPIAFQLALQSRCWSNEDWICLRDGLRHFSKKEKMAILHSMTSLDELEEPMWSSPWRGKKRSTLRDLALACYPKNGFCYGKSYAYGHAAPPASLFKLVTGYEALRQDNCRNASPPLKMFAVYDEPNPSIVTSQGMVLGKTEKGKTIFRRYKGGRLPRSDHQIGKVDFLSAMTKSSNLYFSLLAGEKLENPKDLEKAARMFGFGRKTGIELTGEAKGHVPDDLARSRTALYATAIGQHTLTSSPLQVAQFLSILANGESHPSFCPHMVWGDSHPFSPKVSLPPQVRSPLLEGLQQAVASEEGTAHFRKIRKLAGDAKAKKGYRDLGKDWIGKTATAEFSYRPTLDREAPLLMGKDVWFGAISFEKNASTEKEEQIPELVVVVYLRFGDYGKEAAPLAAEVIQKWREIKKRRAILRFSS